MSKNSNNSTDMKSSSGEVFSYFAIPVETFQSIVDQQTSSGGVSSVAQNLVIKALTEEEVLSIADFTTKHPHPPTTKQHELDIQGKLEREKKRNSKNSNLKCSICKQTFEKMCQYRKHVLEHRNAKKFKCEQCNASYNMEDNFKLHMAIHCKGPPCCPLCDRKFQRLASLKAHLIVHEVDETISCIKCLAEFEKEEDLDAHMQVHNREEIVAVNQTDLPLVCSYCNYTFDDSKAYREHVSQHVKMKKMIFNRRKRKTNLTREYPHKCDSCQKSFSKYSLLERHSRTHSGEKPYICSYCNKGFAQNGTLQIHLSRHKGLKPFSCILCPAKFNQKGNLRVHIQKTHLAPQTGEKVYRCTLCTCIFKRVASLNTHITRVHGNTSKETDEISQVMEQLNKIEQRTNQGNIETKKTSAVETNKVTGVGETNKIVQQDNAGVNDYEVKDESETTTPDATYVRLADSSVEGVVKRYLVRQIIVDDVRIYVCSYCEKQFKKPSDLIRHIRTHTREKPFKCKQCNQSFSLKSTLVTHFNTHMGKKDYKCVICLKMFSSVRTLNKHIKKHNNRNQKPVQQYKCTMCNRTFNSPTKAKAHLSVHDESGKEAQFKEEIVMKQPMLETVNGLLPIAAPKPKFPSVELEEYKNRPFRCNLCTAAFNKPVHLRRHLLRHSGDRRFKCDQCPKAFYSEYSLKEHKKFHSGVKNYTCRLCNKKFITNVTLKRHYATHSPHRPYICPYCKRRFTTVILCRKHIKVHRKEVLKAKEEATQQITKEGLSLVEMGDIVGKDFVTIPLDSYKPESVIVSIGGNGGVAKKVMELPLETDLTNSTNLLQDNVLNQQFYQLPLDVVQEFDVNEINSETTVNDAASNQVSLYINYDDLQTLNTNIYGQLLTQTPQLKLQNDTVLLNEIPDTNTVFSLDNFTETQNFQNYTETVDLNILLNKQVSDITKTTKDDLMAEKSENSAAAADLNLQMDLANTTLPIFTTSIDSNLCEDADVICYTCGATTTLKDLETHNCSQKSQVETIDGVSGESSLQKDKKLNENLVSCTHCNKTFRNKKTYLKHVAVHKHKKAAVHSCQYCEKIFKKPSDLKRHIRTHTGEKPYSCTKCPRSFSLKSTLETHLKTHNPQSNKEFNCPVCNSCFSCKASLKVHTALHTDTKPYSCSMCDAKFRTSGHKKSHEDSHKRGTCRKNNTKAAKISNLLGPVVMDATVLGDKVMSEGATTDEIIFVQNSEQTNIQTDNNIIHEQLNLLNQTIQIDTNLMQQFQNNGLLLQESLEDDVILSAPLQLVSDSIKLPTTIEMNQSESIVKYKCDICDKSYNTKAVLRKHRKIHGNGLEFRCNLCSKGFKDTEELEKHNRVHLGLRPHSCQFCSNTFSEEGSLKTHMKRIHKVSSVSDVLLDYVEQEANFIY